LAINTSIVKASEEGVEIYNINSKKWSILSTPENYSFVRGCGWTRISKETIFLYGGYDDNENGVDTCRIWNLHENELQVRNSCYRLVYKEGFLNSPGIIVDGALYVIQNICMEEGENNEDSEGAILESERSLLCFDGSKWSEIKIRE
jgi:hypothetical protein